jgi:pimeloyl-ACP methyl ester carboxylesterase
MKIKRTSCFKSPVEDIAWFNNWVGQLEMANNRTYQRITLDTSLGKTHIWGLNTDSTITETLVIFPGARTTSLIWDFDRGLDHLGHSLRIFMVETNGLPNLSDGNSPDIQSLDYGHWAAEVFEKLEITNAYLAGASFGGLICMKLAIVHPEKIKAAFLLNPGCLQPFSLSMQNLYYNLLPIIRPTAKNVSTFLDKAVFSKPNHQLTPTSEQMLIDYEVFAIKRYKDKTQKPYYMDTQLDKVKSDTYLLEGDKDLLFPYLRSIENASKHIHPLKEVRVFENVGHGIETYGEAMKYIGDIIKESEVS